MSDPRDVRFVVVAQTHTNAGQITYTYNYSSLAEAEKAVAGFQNLLGAVIVPVSFPAQKRPKIRVAETVVVLGEEDQ